MRQGDLTAGAAKLQKSWKNLLAHWEATKLHWHDPVSREFEARYLDPVAPQIASTLDRMQALAGVLAAANHDCEP